MNDRNIILFINHKTRTFALSTRREEKSRLEELTRIGEDNGYEVSFVAVGLRENQAKAGAAIFRAALESGCGYTYHALTKIERRMKNFFEDLSTIGGVARSTS